MFHVICIVLVLTMPLLTKCEVLYYGSSCFANMNCGFCGICHHGTRICVCAPACQAVDNECQPVFNFNSALGGMYGGAYSNYGGYGSLAFGGGYRQDECGDIAGYPGQKCGFGCSCNGGSSCIAGICTCGAKMVVQNNFCIRSNQPHTMEVAKNDLPPLFAIENNERLQEIQNPPQGRLDHQQVIHYPLQPIAEPLQHIGEPLKHVANTMHHIAEPLQLIADPFHHVATSLQQIADSQQHLPLSFQQEVNYPQPIDVQKSHLQPIAIAANNLQTVAIAETPPVATNHLPIVAYQSMQHIAANPHQTAESLDAQPQIIAGVHNQLQPFVIAEGQTQTVANVSTVRNFSRLKLGSKCIYSKDCILGASCTKSVCHCQLGWQQVGNKCKRKKSDIVVKIRNQGVQK